MDCGIRSGFNMANVHLRSTSSLSTSHLQRASAAREQCMLTRSASLPVVSVVALSLLTLLAT